MKIAFIGQKGIPAQQGGVEKHVEELSTKLVNAGFEVSVYSRPHYTQTNIKSYQGVKIINLPSLKTKHLDAISHTFISTIHALCQDYDVIHYHGVGPSLLAWIPRIFKPKTKILVTFHCLDRQHQKWGALAKLMLTLGEWTACRFPHQTITVSRALQNYCLKKFNRETFYIPNGFSAVEKSDPAKNILRQFNLKKDGYFIAVSRLVPHKGIHTLIKAYQKMTTDKKLVIVGAGANTDNYVTYLNGLAQGHKNIIFTGQQTGRALWTLYKNAYLFVQPSEAEGLSIALLEAMSLGVPVITSDIEENLEVASGLGLKFRNKSEIDLEKKLTYATKNPAAIKAMAQLGRKQIDKNYNWRDIVKKIIAVYEMPISWPKNIKIRNWKLKNTKLEI